VLPSLESRSARPFSMTLHHYSECRICLISEARELLELLYSPSDRAIYLLIPDGFLTLENVTNQEVNYFVDHCEELDQAHQAIAG
jgi:hypothetical protein